MLVGNIYSWNAAIVPEITLMNIELYLFLFHCSKILQPFSIFILLLAVFWHTEILYVTPRQKVEQYNYYIGCKFVYWHTQQRAHPHFHTSWSQVVIISFLIIPSSVGKTREILQGGWQGWKKKNLLFNNAFYFHLNKCFLKIFFWGGELFSVKKCRLSGFPIWSLTFMHLPFWGKITTQSGSRDWASWLPAAELNTEDVSLSHSGVCLWVQLSEFVPMWFP